MSRRFGIGGLLSILRSDWVMLRAWIISRRGRGWTLGSLGPNEARILFDSAAGLGALGASVLFLGLFGTSFEQSWKSPGLLAAPGLFIAFNALLGLYTRLKITGASVKAGVLLASVLATGVVSLVLVQAGASVALWGLLLAPPVVLARLLLALPFVKYPTLVTTLVLNRHGPVAVLGGAGYIGSPPSSCFYRRAIEVRVLDRLMYGRSRCRVHEHPKFELIEGDVTEISKLTAAAAQHVGRHPPRRAGRRPSLRHRLGFHTAHEHRRDPDGQRSSQELGIYRFVFASSCSVYGGPTPRSRRRPLNPVSLYAQTKLDSERELLQGRREISA